MSHPTPILHLLWPELILATTACVLILLGATGRLAARRIAPVLALAALAAVFALHILSPTLNATAADSWGTLRVYRFADYIETLAAGVGVMLVLLAWPTDAQATGNSAINYGSDGPEFFALMLLAITGIFLTASANDMILLFLGVELASIPAYIMVSISRPLAVAQEAGVKYFFLGAMSAAVMLLGFSYLYGSSGLISLDQIAARLHPGAGAAPMDTWLLLAFVLLICALCFKISAVPMHYYAADVYQGAATPVTAFLSFVPKAAGFAALIKVLAVAAGPAWLAPLPLVKLLAVLAVLTMTVGNVLGLLQHNVKRVFAYSSIAHSGYMLVGLAALASGMRSGLQGVLFYLAAYGLMNAAAFGVLILLPGRSTDPATSAETFDDIAGQGRRHVGLGLAMAVSCFGLIGLPLTVGFLGKIMLIRAAYDGGMIFLVVATVINAAISAAYYLRIVATMFLPPAGAGAQTEPAPPAASPLPILAAIVLSVGGTLLFGAVLPAADILTTSAAISAAVDGPRSTPAAFPRGTAPLTKAQVQHAAGPTSGQASD